MGGHTFLCDWKENGLKKLGGHKNVAKNAWRGNLAVRESSRTQFKSNIEFKQYQMVFQLLLLCDFLLSIAEFQ